MTPRFVSTVIVYDIGWGILTKELITNHRNNWNLQYMRETTPEERKHVFFFFQKNVGKSSSVIYKLRGYGTHFSTNFSLFH